MKCELCHKEFKGRKDARFCSAKCRVSYSRQGPQPEKEETLDKKVSSVSGEKMAKAIMALIEGRRKILKGVTPQAVFFLGNTVIKIGLKEVQIDDVVYKLK